MRFALLIGAAGIVTAVATEPMFGGDGLPWMVAPALPGILMSLAISKNGQVNRVWAVIFTWAFYALLFVGVEQIVRRLRGNQKTEK